MATTLLVLFALAGFAISSYIFIRKHKKQRLVCPMGGKCDLVTSSRYANTFGIPNSLVGMGYYAATALVYGLPSVISNVSFAALNPAFKLATLGAFLFSVYLTFIQGFVLKSWCSWCVFSAICTTGIFIIMFFPL